MPSNGSARNHPGGAIAFSGVRHMTDRIYEDLIAYLREEYPDKTEEQLAELAEIINKAWLDGII